MSDGNPVRFHIRPMKVSDIDAVREIDIRSFTLPWPRKAYHFELTENPVSYLWVAETYNSAGQLEVIGFIAMWLIVDEAHISNLATHPAYRGKGVAQELLQTALIFSIQHGARAATLEVRESNEAAQRLYRKFGFQVVGRRQAYYRDNNEDALLMTLGGLQQYDPYLDDPAKVVYDDAGKARGRTAHTS